jgi:hypothetical protein
MKTQDTTTENAHGIAAAKIQRTRCPELTRAVLAALDAGENTETTLADICAHGLEGGFNGFIYTRETVAFFEANREHIVRLAEDMADDMGENVLDMIAGFNCLGGRGDAKARKEFLPSAGRCIYGNGSVADGDYDVADALAWFAAEEVARELSPDA